MIRLDMTNKEAIALYNLLDMLDLAYRPGVSPGVRDHCIKAHAEEVEIEQVKLELKRELDEVIHAMKQPVVALPAPDRLKAGSFSVLEGDRR